jgi:hypothetical protein
MEPRKKLKWEYASPEIVERCTDRAQWIIERGYVDVRKESTEALAKRIYYAEDDDDATA